VSEALRGTKWENAIIVMETDDRGRVFAWVSIGMSNYRFGDLFFNGGLKRHLGRAGFVVLALGLESNLRVSFSTSTSD
jgi:hypothetical protein